MQRTRLGTVQLMGVRSWIRRGGFGVLVACAAIAFVGYLLPAHSRGDHVHSNYADGGPFSLIVLGGFALLALVLRSRGLGAGIVAGISSAAAAIAALVPVALAHLIGGYDNYYGEQVFATGMLGLFFGGIAFAIAEPILYVLQRRADERRAQPNLPMARVYT